MINLTNEQLQTLFNKKAEKENGLNQVLTITLNAIMHSERTAYLKTNQDSKNKGNGYRPVKVNGYGRKLTLAVPRNRLGILNPSSCSPWERKSKKLKTSALSYIEKE